MPNELWHYLVERNPADLGRDVLDLLITYYIFYRVALVVRGTRAMQVGLGLVLVFVLYVIAQVLQLSTVLTLLGAVLSSALLIAVVVFQNDIRRGLMRVGAQARFGSTQHLEAEVIDAVVEAATLLARHRIGAIITFEQEANLEEFVGSHTGFTVDAAVSPELLVALFIPEGMNKLHDGSIIIRDLRIAKAGVFFPMPEGGVMDDSFGSRHRAAMGITEETDAVVIVVSEERGSISFCFSGNIIPHLDGPRLRAALDGVFTPKRRRSRRGAWLKRLGLKRREEDRATDPRSTPRPSLDRASLDTSAEKASSEKASQEAAKPSSTAPAVSSPHGAKSEATETPLRLSVDKLSGPKPDTARADETPKPLRKLPTKPLEDPEAKPNPVPLRDSAGAATSGKIPELQSPAEKDELPPSSRATLEQVHPMPRADETPAQHGERKSPTQGEPT